MKIRPHIFFLLLIVSILSCSDGEDPQAENNAITAEATLLTSGSSCASWGAGGTYAMNEALTASHSIGARINVTKAGSYTIYDGLDIAEARLTPEDLFIAIKRVQCIVICHMHLTSGKYDSAGIIRFIFSTDNQSQHRRKDQRYQSRLLRHPHRHG